MSHTPPGIIPDRTTQARSWIKRTDDATGPERIEAYFNDRGYEMHRHDTYAIGLTLSGVQSFHYRGETRNSPAGGALILHPDEKHDGQSGTETGFHYRMLYLEPALIQNVLKGQPLPFISGGLTQDGNLQTAANRFLANMTKVLDPLERDDALYDLVMALNRLSSSKTLSRQRRIDTQSAETARLFLHSTPEHIDLATLEHITGQDRWRLSRDFRALFGTSPYRYLTLRRLDAARQALLTGHSLASIAADTGFADQSHLTRQFTATYGMTPGQWRTLHDHSRHPLSQSPE